MDRVDTVAKAVRATYLEHAGIRRPPWEEIPEERKVKWRLMAQAAIITDKEFDQ